MVVKHPGLPPDLQTALHSMGTWHCANSP